MVTRVALACATLLASTTPGIAQDVRAWLDPETIALGQTADLVVEVELERVLGRVQEPRLPEIDGARIVGRSRESRVRMAGASVSRTAIYRYAILPAAPGAFRIDPVRVVAGDRSFATAPLRLLVLPSDGAGSRLDREPSPREGPPPIFAVARVDRARAWVGQQVTLTFAFYHDPAYPLAESPDYDPPEAPGFWRMEIDREPLVSLEHFGGRAYHVQRFRYALFPLRAGALEIGPAKVRVVEPDRQRWWEPGRPRTITTDPLEVQVDPLPPAPEGFAGAVGSYHLEGEVRPLATAAGTPIELELTIRGTGNPNAVGAPVLPAWPDVVVRPPTMEAEVQPSAEGVQGEKTFRFLLVPGSPGRLSLGTARLPYFDPAEGTYRADTLRLGEILVAPAPAGSPGAPAGNIALGPTLWPARLPVARRGERGPAGEPWAWVALAGPWGAWLLASGARTALRRRARDPGRAAIGRLETARLQLAREGAPALEEAERALDSALRARYGAAATAGPPRERERALAAAGASRELVLAVAAARSAIAAARFAGARASTGAEGPLADATSALGRVVGQLEPAGGRRWAVALALALVALAGAAAGIAQPAGAPTFAPTASEARGAWQAANDAYRTGDFGAAVRLYPLLLETWADPRLEADLGAALWRSDRPGAAYAHYLHALALDPHAGAVRRDVARLREVLGEPPDARGSLTRLLARTTLDELLLFLAALDLLVFGAFLVARRRPRTRPIATLAGGLLVLALAAAALHAWAVDRAVWAVASERAPIRAAPAALAAPPIAWLPAGSVVRVLERGPVAWRVDARGRPAGWVARDRIVPLHSRGPHAD